MPLEIANKFDVRPSRGSPALSHIIMSAKGRGVLISFKESYGARELSHEQCLERAQVLGVEREARVGESMMVVAGGGGESGVV